MPTFNFFAPLPSSSSMPQGNLSYFVLKIHPCVSTHRLKLTLFAHLNK